jgi:peptidoglycan hydrolase CwlO-like protein
MRIKRLYVRDFGIIRNQTLDDLGPGIIVVGGPNRAGKTSFMQVLRYLGYGFPKGANLPPATHEYHVEASLVLEDQPWEVLITGYSRPRIRSLAGDFHFPDSPFGEVDLFTYHQLFTISLDELRALPEGVLKDDQSRLQSVLLGAGLADVARLPRLRDELEAEADKIGGKYGNPSVRMFKPYHIAIQEGMAQRDNALELIDGYRAKVDELKDTEASIEELQKQLGDARQQIVRLEALLHNYEDYQNWSRLNNILAEPLADTLLVHYPKGLLEKARSLRERYEVALTDYQDKVASLSREGDGREAREWQAALLAKANDIELAVRNLSGISARIEAYERRLVEVQSEERRIKADIDAIDPLWQGESGKIDEIMEKVDQDQLSRSLKEHELLNQAVGIWGRLQGIAVLDFGKQFRMYAMGATIAMILGIILGLWQPLVGTGLVAVAVVGLGLYFLHRTLADGEARAERRGLVGQLVDVGDKLDFAVDVEDLEACSLKLQARLSKVEKDLEFYCNVLDLPIGVSLDRYQARLDAVHRLHGRLQSLRRQDQELEEDAKLLSPALEGLYDLGLELGYMVEPPRPSAASFNRLAMVVDKMSIHLGLAQAVEAAENALAAILSTVNHLDTTRFSGFSTTRSRLYRLHRTSLPSPKLIIGGRFSSHKPSTS